MPRYVPKSLPWFTAGFIAVVLPSCAVMAQTKTEPKPGDPCSTQLQQQSPKGDDGGAQGGTATDSGNANGGDTDSRLSRCGDVLQPPKTGDTDLVKPAPEKGNMPVIKPKVLPKQQNGDPDAG